MTLISDIQAVVEQANIEAGIAIHNIETGEQLDLNGDVFFPMASVFKIPILAAAGLQIAAGTKNLDDRVPLTDEAKSAGSGVLQFFQPGLEPTFRDLLTLMIIISDNTATDMNVELLGGPLAIEKVMHDLGLPDIYVKMDCKNLLKGLFPPEIQNLPREEIKKWSDEHDVVRDGITFQRTPENNVSTAKAMTELCVKLYTGQVVQGAAQEEVMAILLKQQLNQRLPRFLPSTVSFAHKTGTIGGHANDSGIIYVNDTTHVAVTMYTFWNSQDYFQKPEAYIARLFEVESTMGKVGQLVYEHYRG